MNGRRRRGTPHNRNFRAFLEIHRTTCTTHATFLYTEFGQPCVTRVNIEKILERFFLAEEMHSYSELFFQDLCFAVRPFTIGPTRHFGGGIGPSPIQQTVQRWTGE